MHVRGEVVMRIVQWLVAIAFIVAGIALLCAPEKSTAQTPKAYVPTRFTVSDLGTVGKPDVVLIPGLASSKAVWDSEAKLLAPNYRLHLVQVDGFAGAPVGGNAGDGAMLPAIVEELHAYIVSAKLHPAVIGHSLGGLLALMLADKHPEDVSKLVIVDSLPFYGLVFNADATVDAIKPQADAVKQQMLAMPDDQFATMQPMMVGAMVKDKDGQKLVAASSIASDRKVMVNAMYEDLQTDIRGDMATIKTPTLLLYPYDATMNKDEKAWDALYAGAYKGMANVKIVRVDDSRHFIMYDQPGKMDAAMESFLK
jgi:pimeloyl-ACP methyl ester carboxylesterase